MNKSFSISFLFALVIVTLVGCASGPTLTNEQILGQYDEIASLDRGLQEAAVKSTDYLAPEGYEASMEKLDEALKAAHKGQKDVANTAAIQGHKTLAQAKKDAAVSHDLLSEVLVVRNRALNNSAHNLYAEDFRDVDKQLRKTSNLIEKGKLEEAKKRRRDLIDGYSQLELAALKQGTVDAAKATIERVKNEGAQKYAPKTLKLSQEDLSLALSVLDADRTQTVKADAYAKRAKFLAEKSGVITELIKDFKNQDYSQEDVILWHQKQLEVINTPLGTILPFDKPDQTVVHTISQSIIDTKQQLTQTQKKLALVEGKLNELMVASEKELKAVRRQYEQERSLTEQQREEQQQRLSDERKRFENVQLLFDGSEAKVYQQGQNVLISAHGFNFPSGQSEIQTGNFPLLHKVTRAINIFPDSKVEVSGHTDSQGNDELNHTISNLRALKVGKFLREIGGISADRIVTIGYGEERPVASNETRDGRAANRRVEILIINQ